MADGIASSLSDSVVWAKEGLSNAVLESASRPKTLEIFFGEVIGSTGYCILRYSLGKAAGDSMEWKDAVAHLPFTVMCTDKRGRILLLNKETDGVRVGRSFLKFAASKADILAVGRAAKESLSDGKPREVKEAKSINGDVHSVSLLPFGGDDGRAKHLLVMLKPPAPKSEARNWEPTRSPAPQPALEVTRVQEDDVVPVRFSNGLGTAVPPDAPPADVEVSEAREIILIPSPEVESLAQQCATVVAQRLKTRLWPLAQFEASLATKSHSSDLADLDDMVSAHSRLIFLGRSEFAEDVARGAGGGGQHMGANWKILPGKVRRAAIWTTRQDGPTDLDDLLGELQFELGQMSMKAIPFKTKRGITRAIDPGVKLAGDYLEAPGSNLTTGSTLQEQAEEHRYLYAIATFLSEGLESLVS